MGINLLGTDPLGILNALGRVPIPIRDELPGDDFVKGQLGDTWDVLDALGFSEMFLGRPAYDESFRDPRTGGPAQINAGAAPMIPWGGFVNPSWGGGAPMGLFLKGGAHRMGPARSQMDELMRKEKLRELRNIYENRELGLDAATRSIMGRDVKNIRSLPSLGPNEEKFRRYLMYKRDSLLEANQRPDILEDIEATRRWAKGVRYPTQSQIRRLPELDPNEDAFRNYLLQKRGELGASADKLDLAPFRMKEARMKAFEDQRLMEIENLEDVFPDKLAYQLHHNMSPGAFQKLQKIPMDELERLANKRRLDQYRREILGEMETTGEIPNPSAVRSGAADRGIDPHDVGFSPVTGYREMLRKGGELIRRDAKEAAQMGDFTRAARLAKLRIEYLLGNPRAVFARDFGRHYRFESDVPRPGKNAPLDVEPIPFSARYSDDLYRLEPELRADFRYFNELRRKNKFRDYPR